MPAARLAWGEGRKGEAAGFPGNCLPGAYRAGGILPCYFSGHSELSCTDCQKTAIADPRKPFLLATSARSHTMAALNGQTPDEVYFGTGGDVEENLKLARLRAREERMATNLELSCDRCRADAEEAA